VIHEELHVFEKSANLFWGLVILVCTAGGTYLLAGTFVSMDWEPFRPDQLFALGLFSLSFWGIIQLSEPLYHFILYFENDVLTIDIKKGEVHTQTIEIAATDIEALKFAPHKPRSADEALFDFSTDYHLLYKKRSASGYQKLLGLQAAAITLKVDDIAKIMRFISEHNPEISIPRDQASYFNL
jgi:hypothetical protein